MTKQENKAVLFQLRNKIKDYSNAYKNGTLNRAEYAAKIIPLQTAYSYICTEINETVDIVPGWLNLCEDTRR